ncbi:MAG: hypothetical protein GY755_21840 [Chloroflexi bacterium]|nr:hypothetical protein [Chloroflexota bacterium]
MKKGFSSLALALFLTLLYLPAVPIQAQKNPPREKFEGRTEERRITVVTHHWQLVKWSGGTLSCDLFLRHDEWPSYSDVRSSCGDAIMAEWLTTPACNSAIRGNSVDCEGLLLRSIGEVPVTYMETVELPGIDLALAPFNCPVGTWCERRPLLELQAIEPLEEHEIQRVHIRVGRQKKVYNADNAVFNLPLTGEQGSWLEYWAESSYGDRSDRVRVRYRARVSDDGANFHFDLLDSAWKKSLPSGTLLWQVFPPTEGLPSVLIKPESPVQLYTTDPYLYLAGYLIQSGEVNASSCSDGGLYVGGSASPCGAELAEAQVIDWQNRYNAQILQAAQKHNIPPMLLKRVIAQESQFISESNQPYEKGLGYMTSDGVDMILSWNINYYLENCLENFEGYLCSPGYANLGETRQTLLRKYVLDKIGTSEEIEMLAAAIYASAAQSGQMVESLSLLAPIYSSTYVDMWKISAGNYYGGAGCLSEAITQVIDEGRHITWDAITPHLSAECLLVEDYVKKVMRE